MIIDHIEKASLYEGLGERISIALDYLRKTDFSTMAPGKYEIDGENIFAMVNEYNTRQLKDAKLEAHKIYIDIQYMHSGSEKIGYAPLSGQQAAAPFNTEQDCGFYNGDLSLFDFKEKMFAVFYPTDLHMPGIGETESPVRKVVVKVRA